MDQTRTDEIPPSGQDWKPVVRQPGAGVGGIPIDAVLSQTLVAFASDYEQHRMGAIPIAMALRHATDEWVPVSDFPPEARITGEGKSLMERHGIVDLRLDPSAPLTPGHKGNTARPSATGRAIRDSYEPITVHVENDWRERYGAPHVDRLRAALEELGSKLPPGLPDYVITTQVSH